jgi:hypothetical protein
MANGENNTAAAAHARYMSPLTSRYASDEMAYNFSDNRKFSTWRMARL